MLIRLSPAAIGQRSGDDPDGASGAVLMSLGADRLNPLADVLGEHRERSAGRGGGGGVMEVRTLKCAASACPGCLACDHQMALDEIASLRTQLAASEQARRERTAEWKTALGERDDQRKRAERAEAERDKAFRMIVLLMDQREWGAATGALHEDPIVKAAYAARRGEGGSD